MIKDIVLVLMAAMLCIVGFHSCNLEDDNSKKQKDLIEALLGNESLKKNIDSKNREITEVKSIVVTKDKDIQKALKEIDKLKKLDAKIVFKTKTKFDTISVLLRDTLIIHEADTTKSKRFDYKDDWLNISGFVLQDSLSFDSLVVNNQYNIELGSVRKGLFKKEKTVFIRNENPYSKTTQAQSFILKDEKKWYQKDIVKMGLTAIGTFFIVSSL